MLPISKGLLKRKTIKILWKTFLRRLTEIVKMPWRESNHWNKNSVYTLSVVLNTKTILSQDKKYSLKNSLSSRICWIKNTRSKNFKRRKRKFRMPSQSFSLNIASTCRSSISIWFFIASKKKIRKWSLSSLSDAWL